MKDSRRDIPSGGWGAHGACFNLWSSGTSRRGSLSFLVSNMGWGQLEDTKKLGRSPSGCPPRLVAVLRHQHHQKEISDLPQCFSTLTDVFFFFLSLSNVVHQNHQFKSCRNSQCLRRINYTVIMFP